MSGSWLRGVHPLLKIATAMVWLAAAVVLSNPPALGVLAGGAALLALSAGMWRHPRPALVTLLGLGALGGCHLVIGGTPTQAFATTARLLVFAGIGGVLMITTDPVDLLRALSGLPLPAALRLGLHLLWRSVGVLLREFAAIHFAARADGQEGLLWRPARSFRCIVLPLAFAMTGYADDVTLALFTRGIRLDRRPGSAAPPHAWGLRDLSFGLMSLAVLAGATLTSTGLLW